MTLNQGDDLFDTEAPQKQGSVSRIWWGLVQQLPGVGERLIEGVNDRLTFRRIVTRGDHQAALLPVAADPFSACPGVAGGFGASETHRIKLRYRRYTPDLREIFLSSPQ